MFFVFYFLRGRRGEGIFEKGCGRRESEASRVVFCLCRSLVLVGSIDFESERFVLEVCFVIDWLRCFGYVLVLVFSSVKWG